MKAALKQQLADHPIEDADESVPPFTGETVDHVREYLDKYLDEGVVCPCCTQFAKRYRRTITAAMARTMIVLYRLDHGQPARRYHHVSIFDISRSRGDFAKVRHWDFAKERPKDVDGEDARAASGYWQLSARGVAFVENRLRVPKYVFLRNGGAVDRSHGHENPLVCIADCLAVEFSYAELMAFSCAELMASTTPDPRRNA